MQVDYDQVVVWANLFRKLRPNSGPLRTVLYTSSKSDLVSSYGIITYCFKTDRILLIKKPHTYQYYEFVRALWRSQDLFFLISGMSNEERVRLLYLDIESECEKLLFLHGQHAKTKYEENLDLIKAILNTFDFVDNLPYSIPKGRARLGEDTYLAALREFEEETGLKPFGKLITHTIEKIEYGCSSKIYTSQLWIHIVKEEVEPPTLKTNESNGGIWLDRRLCSSWIDLNSFMSVLLGKVLDPLLSGK